MFTFSTGSSKAEQTLAGARSAGTSCWFGLQVPSCREPGHQLKSPSFPADVPQGPEPRGPEPPLLQIAGVGQNVTPHRRWVMGGLAMTDRCLNIKPTVCLKARQMLRCTWERAVADLP